MKYIPQLDGLRAIAVVLVIISHWYIDIGFINNLHLGTIGVQLFFVLSGYLITTILIRSRGAQHAVKNFYIRRTLRIFPIYYLTIFALYFLGNYTQAVSGTNIRPSFIYHLTYTSNIYFFLQNNWDGFLSHLWSLSVEEQFYLIWPWLILFVPKRLLFTTIIAFIVIGAVFSFCLQDFGQWVLTPCHFFGFGLGALLSWYQNYREDLLPSFYKFVKVAGLFTLAFFAFSLYSPNKFPLALPVDVMGLWMICLTINKGGVLTRKPFVFIGKISYGLYLYHNLVPPLITDNLIRPHMPLIILDRWLLISPLISAVILLPIAWMSYITIEKRFLKLKSRFEIKPVKKTPKVLDLVEAQSLR